MFPSPAVAPVIPGILLSFLLFLFFLCGAGFCNELPDPAIGTETAVTTVAAPLSCPKISVNGSAARAGLLYDLEAKQVVWQKNMETVYPIASLTKMMVALIAMEEIYSGKLDRKAPVKVSGEATRVGGSSARLKTGGMVTVEDLIKAAMISSGNDASYMLAQHMGGTETAFVERMNRRAAQLGMNNTRYSNSTGMPARKRANDNRSTPSDLLKLSIEMLKYKELLDIASIGQEFIAQDTNRLKIRNHNHLVEAFEEFDGFKTGFTLNAKFCLVATACKQDRRLIAIALGVSSSTLRNRFVASMTNSYYEELGIGPLCKKSDYAYRRYVGDHRTDTIRVAAASSGGAAVHRIRKGETLYHISKKYKCSVADLKRWNGLNGSSIRAGQKLKVHSSRAIASASPVSNPRKSNGSIVYYKVRPGDTLWNIASQYQGVSVKKIMRENRIKRANSLKPGTTLKIVLNV